MIDKYSGDRKTIFIADRGYESYNSFAHAIENNVYFLIRGKDITSNGIYIRIETFASENR